jgi:hypothetical protein
MKKTLLFLFLNLIFISTQAQFSTSGWWDKEIILSENQQVYVTPKIIIQDKWDTLPQAQFWKQILSLSKDSCLINVANTRRVLHKMSFEVWNNQTDIQKTKFKDSLKRIYGLDSMVKLNVTFGKNDFYKIKEVSPTISEGIREFRNLGVDPWYAQSILMIESPAQMKKSSSGAYGPFQLMPSVARAYGLTVSNYKDERSDFKRSAYGAAKLIKHVCIPEAKNILNRYNLPYNESDLWFRLFVMHVYHAGSGNVSAVMKKIQPSSGGQDLIQKMWTTSAGAFGNSSQNYTQITLAAHLVLNDILKLHTQ